MDDIFDNGTPKYQSPQDIYDAVQAMASGEEIGIISEMFSDVSWENQDYYYADNGEKLLERWQNATEYGNKMWTMDVAAWQLEDEDANNWIYEILNNDELAKRIGWKKLFVDAALNGSSKFYDGITEEFLYELGELNRFSFYANLGALQRAMESKKYSFDYQAIQNTYGEFTSSIFKKLKGLRLDNERQLIVESRAMLTAYDDFMFGLRSNQALYNQQEIMYQQKAASLKAAYEDKVRKLLALAQSKGLVIEMQEIVLIGEGNNNG